MDELKIKLSTRFMRNFVSKLIAKAIFKKTGYKFDIQINEISVETIDGKTKVHINADGEIDNNNFIKALKQVGLD